jgi:DNA-binding MarR family transcriptional regulator
MASDTNTTDTTDSRAASVRALGPALGLAERTLRRGLLSVLAETGTPVQTWYAFQRLSVFAAAPTAAAFRRDLSETLDLDGPAAAALLAEITAAGLMHEVSDPAGGDPRIACTAAGDDLQRRIRASLAAGTSELLAPFDPADVATTIRTLTALTERARELHADPR